MGSFTVGVTRSTVAPAAFTNLASVLMPAKVPLPRTMLSGVDVMKRNCIGNGPWASADSYVGILTQPFLRSHSYEAMGGQSVIITGCDACFVLPVLSGQSSSCWRFCWRCPVVTAGRGLLGWG